MDMPSVTLCYAVPCHNRTQSYMIQGRQISCQLDKVPGLQISCRNKQQVWCSCFSHSILPSVHLRIFGNVGNSWCDLLLIWVKFCFPEEIFMSSCLLVRGLFGGKKGWPRVRRGKVLLKGKMEWPGSWLIRMGWCKKDVTPLLMHWSYVFLALTHWYNVKHSSTLKFVCCVSPENKHFMCWIENINHWDLRECWNPSSW